ncbi:hypothetical protein MHYP_G00086700 [Metynnis hypsauchen]
MAAAAAAPPSRAVEFPIEIRSESSRQQHKQKTQRETPETLFKDCSTLNGRRTTTNLLFYTERSTAWHSAMRKYFTHTTKRGICKGSQIYIFEEAEKDSENRLLTVNLYQNAQKPTVQPQLLNHYKLREKQSPPHHPTVTVQHSAPSANTAPPPSPRLHSTVAEIRNSLSLLEVELVELREHIHTHISTSTDMRFLRDQLSLTTNQLQELKGDIENLRQEKEALKNELTNVRVNTTKELEQVKQELKREIVSLKDELHQRDTTIKTLKTQMETPTKQLNTTHTALQPSPSTSQPSNTQNLPITQQDHPEPPSETPRTPPKKVRNPTAEETAEQHSSRPCTGKDIDVAVLIDSNGKFLQEDKLFPGQTTSKIWCPKIRDAHRIISDPNLGTPKYFIIHTGTNDLRLEQERVGGLVCRVAERAAESFPNAKIIISTLLPRKDFHPATIQRVNADISRGCALLPNVHLAHHSTITPYHLYDHVHLNKHMIKEFARTLKDVAQGRHSYSVQQHRAESLKPQHHHHRYTAISPVVYKHYLRARHLPGQCSPPQPTLRAPPPIIFFSCVLLPDQHLLELLCAVLGPSVGS